MECGAILQAWGRRVSVSLLKEPCSLFKSLTVSSLEVEGWRFLIDPVAAREGPHPAVFQQATDLAMVHQVPPAVLGPTLETYTPLEAQGLDPVGLEGLGD